MNPLWNDAVLRRLKKAAARQNPADARKAEALRRRRRWAGRREVGKQLAGRIFIALAFACLGSLFAWRQDIPIEVCAAFSAATWCLGGLALLTTFQSAGDYRPAWFATLLSIVPGEVTLLQDIVHRETRIRLLRAAAVLAVVAGGVAACYGRVWWEGRSWMLVPVVVALLWMQSVAITALLLSPPSPIRRLAAWWMQSIGDGARLMAMLVLALACLAVLFAPLGLNTRFGGVLQSAGLALFPWLPPAGVLLWPGHPERVPWLHLALTAGLLWLAQPGLRRIVQTWRVAPLFEPAQWDWYGGPCGHEDFGADEPEEEGGEPLEAHGEGRAEAKPEPPPAAITTPALPEPATVGQLGMLAWQVRTEIDSPRWHGDKFLLGIDSRPLLDWTTLRPKLAWVTGTVAVCSLIGHFVSLIAGWLAVLVAACASLKEEKPFRVTSTVPWGDGRAVPVCLWLPCSIRPAWRIEAGEANRAFLKTLALAWSLALPAGLAAWACLPLGRHWPWFPEDAPSVPAWVPPLACIGFSTLLALVNRLWAPFRFLHRLQLAARPAGHWKRFDSLVFPLKCAALFLLVVAGIFGFLILPAASVFDKPKPGWGAAVFVIACFALSEILRLLAVRLMYYQWEHGRKR